MRLSMSRTKTLWPTPWQLSSQSCFGSFLGHEPTHQEANWRLRIMVNLVLLGVEVDIAAAMPYHETPKWFYDAWAGVRIFLQNVLCHCHKGQGSDTGCTVWHSKFFDSCVIWQCLTRQVAYFFLYNTNMCTCLYGSLYVWECIFWSWYIRPCIVGFPTKEINLAVVVIFTFEVVAKIALFGYRDFFCGRDSWCLGCWLLWSVLVTPFRCPKDKHEVINKRSLHVVSWYAWKAKGATFWLWILQPRWNAFDFVVVALSVANLKTWADPSYGMNLKWLYPVLQRGGHKDKNGKQYRHAKRDNEYTANLWMYEYIEHRV